MHMMPQPAMHVNMTQSLGSFMEIYDLYVSMLNVGIVVEMILELLDSVIVELLVLQLVEPSAVRMSYVLR